jgi:hypothetical protein
MEFGAYPLGGIRPSQIRSWITGLGEEGLEASYIYALHGRLAQIMSDAVHDGLVAKSPCSRRTSPHIAQQRVYVATTEQVWELYELFPARIRLVVLLGAFIGLRLAEACGLRPEDIDFMRAVVHPQIQYPAEPLKTKISRTPVPIPASLTAELSAQIARYGRYGTLLTGGMAASCRPGRSSEPCEKPARRFRASPQASATTICGTTLPACSSPRALTSRPFRPGYVTPALRPPSTPTVTSGPIGMSQPAPLSMPSSLPGRNSGGTAATQQDNDAGHDPSSGQTS